MVRRVQLAVLLGLVAIAAAQEAAEVVEEPSTRPPLTGNPQIDYVHDPNLPHELIGYDLSNYPFYNRLPKDLLDPKFNFTCEGRHDGFYASIPHKCQVYHNCLFSQRYDFLCANFTVFDQKNFICHYVSEVDCEGSAKHYDRNEELYVTTTTSTTTHAPPQVIYVNRPRPLRGSGRIRPKNPRRPSFGGGDAGGGDAGGGDAGGGGGGGGGGRKRPPGKRRQGGRRTTTTTPSPDYYEYDYYDYDYDYYDYYDYENEQSTTTTAKPRRRGNRPRGGNRPRQGGQGGRQGNEERSGTGGARRGGGGTGGRNRLQSRNNPSDTVDEPTDPRSSRLQAGGARDQEVAGGTEQDPQPNAPSGPRRRRPNRPRPKINFGSSKPTTTTTTTTTTEAPADYYYDDYYDYAQDTPDTTTTTTTTAAPSRRTRPSSRTRVRGGSDATAAEVDVATNNSPDTGARDNLRVSVRRTPVASDRQPVEREEEAAAPVERNRPRFPSRRGGATRDEPQAAEEEAPVVIEEAVEEVVEPEEEQPTNRRRVVSRRRPSRPGPTPPQPATPDYYYDY